MSNRETFYDILGVSHSASDDDIRKAYKKLAMRWHPDKNPTDTEKATEMFKKIAEAYDTLSDAQKRRDYDDCLVGGRSFGDTTGADQARRGFQQRAPKFRSGGGFDERQAFDIFESFFASFHDDFFGDPFFERHFQDVYGGGGRHGSGGQQQQQQQQQQQRTGHGAAGMGDFFGSDPFFGGIGGHRGGGGRGGFGFPGGPSSLMGGFFGGDPFHNEFFSSEGGGGGGGGAQSFSTSFSSSSSSRISMGGGGGGRSVKTSSYTDRSGRTVTRKETTTFRPDGTSETSVEEFVQDPTGRIENRGSHGHGAAAADGSSSSYLLQDGRRGGDGERKRSAPSSSSRGASSSSSSSSARSASDGQAGGKLGRVYSYA